MYRPRAFAVTDSDDQFELIERSGFGHLVSFGSDGYQATGLPFLVDRQRGGAGVLRGHLARANPHWQALDRVPVLVLFQLTSGYVTPSWYPSKAEHGKVVPTWDYEVVHAHGVARVHDDPDWVRRLVTDLTDHHESSHPGRTPAPPWAVTDAPDDFVDTKVRGIVGIEVEIEFVESARKLSQNRPAADRQGVAEGLASSSDPADLALGRAIRSVLDE